jgi:indolepyruvate ferredoxin oxidoreductase beta subunit
MKPFNAYLTGVGGQGIGLLSEMILRAADHAGYAVKSVDTHGLAQRGGIVVSQIRMGDAVFSPLIPGGQADLVVSLERHEALRAAAAMLRPGGALIYYDTVWQPLSVRLDEAAEISPADVDGHCRTHGIRCHSVFRDGLQDIRTQNIVVLAEIDRNGLIPGVGREHYRQAMTDLMDGAMLETNQRLFLGRPDNAGDETPG